MRWRSRWLPASCPSVAGPLGEFMVMVVVSGLDEKYGCTFCLTAMLLTTRLSPDLCSPAPNSVSLPILTCSFCMRRVGLWNFHQMEGAEDEVFQSSPSPTATTTQAPGPVAATVVVTPAAPVAQEGQGGETPAASPTHTTSPTPTPTTPTTTTPTPTTPSRMKLRSQDTTRSDQVRDGCLMFLCYRSFLFVVNLNIELNRRLSWLCGAFPQQAESPLSTSSLTRGKRQAVATRGRGQDGSASPQNTPKRIRLSSAGGPVRRATQCCCC